MTLSTIFRVPIGLLLFALLGGAQARANDTPATMIELHSRAVLRELDARRDEFRKTPEALNAFVNTELSAIFDREYSARLVLGRFGRDASAAQIAAFAHALGDNLLRRYGKALLDVDPGLDVHIKAETPLRDGKIIRVATEIVRRAGAAVPVDYLFRQNAEGWRAFDVLVEGVSYVQTYRNQFDTLLRRESLDEVTRRLAAGEIRAGK